MALSNAATLMLHRHGLRPPPLTAVDDAAAACWSRCRSVMAAGAAWQDLRNGCRPRRCHHRCRAAVAAAGRAAAAFAAAKQRGLASAPPVHPCKRRPQRRWALLLAWLRLARLARPCLAHRRRHRPAGGVFRSAAAVPAEARPPGCPYPPPQQVALLSLFDLWFRLSFCCCCCRRQRRHPIAAAGPLSQLRRRHAGCCRLQLCFLTLSKLRHPAKHR